MHEVYPVVLRFDIMQVVCLISRPTNEPLWERAGSLPQGSIFKFE